MKNKVINAAVCDARDVTERSLAGFDSITINAASLIINERSKELLNSYPVTMNVANVLEVPDGQRVIVECMNGKGEIGPDTDGTGTLLLVNGKLTVADGSRDAVKSFYRIVVNGKALMPKSCQGQFTNVVVNGKTEYYPDGAALLRPDTEIDSLFIARAAKPLYYCPGNLFFLDGGIDAETVTAKNLKFGARRVVIAEGLLGKLITQIDEEAEIVRVPDGTKAVCDDLDLRPKSIRKYGTRLFVCGGVSITDAEALSSLEYLFAEGTVRVAGDLEEAFEAVESQYGELQIIDPAGGYITDRPVLRVGAAMLKQYPNGLRIEDCAKVVLAGDLSPKDIMEKLQIEDCAVVVCSKEQEAAVNMVTTDVAFIKASSRVPDEAEDGSAGGLLGGLLGKLSNTQVINAVEYKM